MRQFATRHPLFLLILILAGIVNPLSAQKADSIRVEQAGDFVKIFYKIVGSNQNQTFRVSLMASINGGLRSEPRSVSGDIGENIVGGKSEYWILWDVLKDVEELTSVEFFVKSELLRDLSEPADGQRAGVTNKYEKRRFNVMPVVSMPGPRVGGMLGVNGSFGILAGAAYGEVSQPEVLEVSIGGEEYHRGEGIQITVNLTKRLVSYNNFQLHAAGGITVAAMDYSVTEYIGPVEQNIRFDNVMTRGLSAGLLMGTGRVSAVLMLMKYDPGSVEQSRDNYRLLSGMTLFTGGIGVRF